MLMRLKLLSLLRALIISDGHRKQPLPCGFPVNDAFGHLAETGRLGPQKPGCHTESFPGRYAAPAARSRRGDLNGSGVGRDMSLRHARRNGPDKVARGLPQLTGVVLGVPASGIRHRG